MNFAHFFLFLNYLKTLHWLTKSYAHHKILDEAYSDFSTKIDEFVESCIGVNAPKSFNDIAVSFSVPEEGKTLFFFLKEHLMTL